MTPEINGSRRRVPKGDIIFRAFAGCAARDPDEMIE
jgi:hypothetical protein